jgi:hypothetical protein
MNILARDIESYLESWKAGKLESWKAKSWKKMGNKMKNRQR